MKVRDVMKSKPSLCRPQDRLLDAGTMMVQVGCGVLPVVDAEDRLTGVLTDRDICRAVTDGDRQPSGVRVADAMTRQVHSCLATDSIQDGLEIMRHYRIRRLPVIDGERRVTGLLSLDDVAVAAHGANGEASGLTWKEVGETLQAISDHPVLARVASSGA